MNLCKQIQSMERLDGAFLFHTNCADIKVCFVTDEIVRIRVAFDRELAEESYVLATTAWEDRLDGLFAGERTRVAPVAPTVTVADEAITFETAAVRLVAERDPLCFKLYDKDGVLLHSDLAGSPYTLDANRRVTHYSAMAEEDCFYGFGEKAGELNKNKKFLRQRATDVNDIKTSLLQLLLGVKTVDLAAVEPGSVLVAADFTPSMTSAMNRKNTVAMVAETGGVTSHSAILARAFEMPAVLSAAGACTQIRDGDLVIADGFSGDLFIAPDEETVEAYRQKQAEYSKEKALLDVYRTRPTVTKSGVHRSVYANIGSPAEAQVALESSAEGIGLFRTEFLFMDRPALPDEEEQYKAYAEVAEAMAGKEVIIRTLDVGGDKDIPYLQMEKEENPFLGCRAIRYCLKHPEVFKVQLRALLRAACCGRIKIMLPMICTAEEIRQARALIAECAGELAAEGKPFRRDVPVGIMVETPAAALTSDLLAKEADFFSIGTNDLTGYVTACDRGNADVAYLYDAMQPAVQRAIQMTIENARRAGIPVGMCGEAAADQRLIPQLNAWGLDEFSVSPSSVLSTRKCICACD